MATDHSMPEISPAEAHQLIESGKAKMLFASCVEPVPTLGAVDPDELKVEVQAGVFEIRYDSESETDD